MSSTTYPAAQPILAALLASTIAVGCKTEVAQTAALDPDRLLDCTAPGGLALPDDAEFGDGGEPATVLGGGTYGGGAGPGLFVAARDAFRVYLNGSLVAASASPRQAIFVPLTLLPGENALSVVVAARRGTPAAIVQLDQIEQSYVSDGTWKVSTSPGTTGYSNPSYDDSSWATANDYGAYGSLPQCDPAAAFPSASTAHWIGPAPETGAVAVLRKAIAIAPVGFGEGTTGGGTVPPTIVASWTDLQAAALTPATPAVILLAEGTYDFRDAPRSQAVCPSTCTDDPTKTLYTVLSGTQTCANALVSQMRDDRTLLLGSNKTIVGLGRGAAIGGVTLEFGSSQNLIVRNVALFDVNPTLTEAGAAFKLDAPNHLWIDHCTTKWISENFADLGAGAQGATLSWMHFDGTTSDECGGEHTLAITADGATATIHHCFFDHVETHSPKALDAPARVHAFNNLLSDNPGYGVGSECGAQVLIEGNTFQRVATPTNRGDCADGGSAMGLINAPLGSNYYGSDVGPHHGGADGGEPHDSVFVPPYSYTVDEAQNEWLTVLARAGAGGPWALPLALP